VTATLLRVPYDLGREGGHADGVAVLADALAELADGDVTVDRGPFAHELGACFDIVRKLAGVVRDVVAAGSFPLILAGNCHSCLGTVAGLDGEIGVVWLDAHADFNTPDTTASGYLDGMALALLTGSGFETLRASVPGHRPVPAEHVVLMARDPDEGERRRLEDTGLALTPFAKLVDALDGLAELVSDVYLHIDLDVLDPSVGRANAYAVEGGLTAAQLQAAVDLVHDRFTIRAAAFTAYDPQYDSARAIPEAARDVAEWMLRTEVWR
jgi:arginase